MTVCPVSHKGYNFHVALAVLAKQGGKTVQEDCGAHSRASNRYVVAVFWYGDFKNVRKYGLLKKNTAANLSKITAVKSSVDFENPLKFVIAAAVSPVSAHRP